MTRTRLTSSPGSAASCRAPSPRGPAGCSVAQTAPPPWHHPDMCEEPWMCNPTSSHHHSSSAACSHKLLFEPLITKVSKPLQYFSYDEWQLTEEHWGRYSSKCHLCTFGFLQPSYQGTGYHNEELENIQVWRLEHYFNSRHIWFEIKNLPSYLPSQRFEHLFWRKVRSLTDSPIKPRDLVKEYNNNKYLYRRD